MRTSKAFSTIDYNTEDFLTLKLDELITQGKIDFYAFIEHLPEEDEKKSHKHLFVIPNGLYETSRLVDHLKEFDQTNPEHPLTCINASSSKFGDWYFYVLHDKNYLLTKGQSRKYHYTKDDIRTSSEDYLNELIHQIDMSKVNRMTLIQEAIKDGITFEELVAVGKIPVQLIAQYEKAYYTTCNYVLGNHTFRDDRETHTPIEEPKIK